MSNFSDYSLKTDTLQRDKIRIIKGYLKALEGTGVADWYEAVAMKEGGQAVVSLDAYATEERFHYIKQIKNAYLQYEDVYNQLEKQIKNGQVHVYRAMQVRASYIKKLIEDDMTPPLGIYWTYDKKSARIWATPEAGEDVNIVMRLEGEVAENAVDWGTTLYYNLHVEFAGEHEIRIPTGNQVKLINIWLERPLNGFDSTLNKDEIIEHLRSMKKTWLFDDAFFQWVVSRFSGSTDADPVYKQMKNFYINYYLDHFNFNLLNAQSLYSLFVHFDLFSLLNLKTSDGYPDYYKYANNLDNLRDVYTKNEEKIKGYMKSNPQLVWSFMLWVHSAKEVALQGAFEELIKQPWVTEIPLDSQLGFNFQLNEKDRENLKKKTFKT